MKNIQQMVLPKAAILFALHGLWIFPFISLVVAYILSAKAGVVTSDYFFISAAVNDDVFYDLQGAAHRIGGVGLCLTAQSLLFVVFGVHYHRCMELSAVVDKQPNQMRLQWLQNVSTVIGFITSFGLTGVSHFDFYYDLLSHMVFAILFIVGATLFMLTQCIIDWQVHGIGYKLDNRIFIIRQAFSVAAIISVVIFVITYFVSHERYWGISSAFEVILVLCFLLYWATWHGRFCSQMYLSIEKPEENARVEIPQISCDV